MKQYDLNNARLVEIGEDEIPAVEAIARRALSSTYDAYIPADKELTEDDAEDDERPKAQFFGKRGAAYKIVIGDDVVGGVFLSFDPFGDSVHCATLSLLGIRADMQGKGIGQKVWRKLEEIHSDVRIWRLHTPAFALRNLAFYVNQCGFVLYDITTGSERFDWHMFRLRKIVAGTHQHE
ncbi:GNAT family N-acetyltransferase [Brucella intermedia]|uniref:GNAT family N-acetyltransferase n=1 Tax=Brucella intermedia TaxID=94625 RepID=UPI00224AAF88|nr:GNAT family N-acetyltransferase [Brucella intermedia]